MEKKEEFIRVGTTLYKIVNQPRSSARKSRWRSRRFGKWCRSAGSWLLHPIRFPTRPTNMTTTVNAATYPLGGLDGTTR